MASTSSLASPSPRRPAKAGRSSPLLRWLRFALYATLVGAVLARNADSILQTLKLATSPLYWATWSPCLPCALAMVGVCCGYLLWLSGATLAEWRMPLVVHLIPIGLITHSLLAGPLARRSDGYSGQGPADRAVAAMRALGSEIERRGAAPCRTPALEYEQALADNRALAPPGYRSFGRPLRFRVVATEGSEPRRMPGNPAELHLVCSGNRYWISAVTTDRVPIGLPAMVRDGVGRIAVVTGELAP